MSEDDIARLREKVRIEPDNPDPKAELGKRLLTLQRYAEAESLFRDCTRLRSGHAEYHALLGQVLSALGRQPEAGEAFGEAVQREPGNPEFHADLGRNRSGQGRHAGAETAFRQALHIGPGTASHYAGLGRALADQGRYQDAESGLREAAQRDRGNPGYRDDLGQALAGQGRHADAEVLFREAITLDPAAPAYHTHLGRALAGQGRLAEAEAAFRESIQLLPSPAPAHIGLGQALAGPRGSGKTELARPSTELRPLEPPNRKIPLMLWAPAKYDAQTFLLRLLKELCISIISVGSGSAQEYDRLYYSERRHQRHFRLPIAGGLTGLGLAILGARMAEVKVSTLAPFVMGGILILAGAAVFVASHGPRPLNSDSDAPIRRPTIERAMELRTRVEYTETQTRDAKLGISGYGLSVATAKGSQFARVPLNEVDVVRELRGLVKSVAEDGWQVVIAIDELDKMCDADEAMAFLESKPPLLCDVLTALLRKDLNDKLRASDMRTRSDRGSGTQIMAAWPEIWPDPDETERWLAGACRAREGRAPVTTSLEASEDAGCGVPGTDYIEAYIAVLHTIRQAFSPAGRSAGSGRSLRPVTSCSRDSTASPRPGGTWRATSRSPGNASMRRASSSD